MASKSKYNVSYIGPKAIKLVENTEEMTPAGSKIVRVTYADESVEFLSEPMYGKVVTDKPCDLDKLREKRCHPVVEVMLAALREYGIKLSELGYISALLNASLDANRDAALNALWAQWGPKPLAPDEVSLLVIDRVLKTHGK